MATQAILDLQENNQLYSGNSANTEEDYSGDKNALPSAPQPQTQEMGQEVAQGNNDNPQEADSRRGTSNEFKGLEQATIAKSSPKRVDPFKLKKTVLLVKRETRAKQKDYRGVEQQIAKSKRLKAASRVSKDKLDVSVYNPQTLNGDWKSIDTKDLEAKIKEIALQIKSKVKNDGPVSKRMRVFQPNGSKTVSKKTTILTPLKNKGDLDQFSLTSPNSLKQAPLSNSPIRLESPAEVSQLGSQAIVKSILKKDLLGRIFKQIEGKQKESRNKLRLDPIKHRYPVTSFRKSVLLEDKSFQLRKAERQREKELKLVKRKEVFNSSRYQRYTQILLKSPADRFSRMVKEVEGREQVMEVEGGEQEIMVQEKGQQMEVERRQKSHTSSGLSIDLPQNIAEGNMESSLFQSRTAVNKKEATTSIKQIDNLIHMMDSNDSFGLSKKPKDQATLHQSPTEIKPPVENEST